MPTLIPFSLATREKTEEKTNHLRPYMLYLFFYPLESKSSIK